MRDATPWYAFDTRVGTYQERKEVSASRDRCLIALYIAFLSYPILPLLSPLSASSLLPVALSLSDLRRSFPRFLSIPALPVRDSAIASRPVC